MQRYEFAAPAIPLDFDPGKLLQDADLVLEGNEDFERWCARVCWRFAGVGAFIGPSQQAVRSR